MYKKLFYTRRKRQVQKFGRISLQCAFQPVTKPRSSLLDVLPLSLLLATFYLSLPRPKRPKKDLTLLIVFLDWLVSGLGGGEAKLRKSSGGGKRVYGEGVSRKPARREYSCSASGVGAIMRRLEYDHVLAVKLSERGLGWNDLGEGACVGLL